VTVLSVVVRSCNTKSHLRACLESLKVCLPMSSEVLVVDDASRDGSARMVADEFHHVRLLKNTQRTGLAATMNLGLRAARGAYVLFLHADAIVTGSSIKQMIAFLETNLRYGAVAPRLVDLDGATLAMHKRLPNLWTPILHGTPLERALPANREVQRYLARDFDYERDGDVECPSGACLLMRRKALRKESAFDETMGAEFHEADLCARLAEAGWRIGYLEAARVVYAGGYVEASAPDHESEYQRNRLAFYRKHHGEVAAWWVKACVALTVVELYVVECYRRAEGWPEEPLSPVWEHFTGFLRA